MHRTLLLVLLLVASCSRAPASAPPLPTSIAAIGDSVTVATNVCCGYGVHPDRSWSTGEDADVDSHLERLRRLGAAPAAANLAVAGAAMEDAPRQAAEAVRVGADYVTFLLGANDVCRGTAPDVFRRDYSRALDVLASGLPPGAHVFVASIPDVTRLWTLFGDEPVARAIWGLANICPEVLTADAAVRDEARRRLQTFNTILATGCARVEGCRYDDGAVYARDFGVDDVSRLDYFHPSIRGQAALAAITWDASWWG